MPPFYYINPYELPITFVPALHETRHDVVAADSTHHQHVGITGVHWIFPPSPQRCCCFRVCVDQFHLFTISAVLPFAHPLPIDRPPPHLLPVASNGCSASSARQISAVEPTIGSCRDGQFGVRRSSQSFQIRSNLQSSSHIYCHCKRFIQFNETKAQQQA